MPAQFRMPAPAAAEQALSVLTACAASLDAASGGSLLDCFAAVPDPRKPQGIRHSLVPGAPDFPDRDPIGFFSGRETNRVPEKAKRYSPEFKEQAAKKVAGNSLPIVKVARELGINESTLGFWVKDYRNKLARQPLPPGMPDRERMREPGRRNRDLEMEVAFLKKAAAYFARERR